MPPLAADTELPGQTPTTLQDKIQQVQQQQALLTQIRASADPLRIQRADALEAQYHVRDMAAGTWGQVLFYYICQSRTHLYPGHFALNSLAHSTT